MNTLHVKRLTSDDKPTLGIVRVKGEFVCFSLEDRPREVKVKGDTRIPAGRYLLAWRHAGKWARRYKARGFPGSLQLLTVPGFTDVLIHAGNTKRDTAGCVLMGLGANSADRTITQSRLACDEVYSRLAADTDAAWWLVIEDPVEV